MDKTDVGRMAVTGSGGAEMTVFTVLFATCFCHFLNDTMQSMLPAVYPLMKSSLGLTFAEIGLVTLTLQVTSSLVQPLVGIYADSHHHSWQLAVGMLFTITGLFMLSVAESLPVVLVSVAFMGCGSSVFHPQASQVSQLASGGRRGLAQSIFQVGGNGGYAFGPLLAAAVIVPNGMRAVGWLGVLALLAAVILLYIGRWHVRALREQRRRNVPTWATARHYGRQRVAFFVVVLLVLMFSKNFYSACMVNYFTFFLIGKFHVSISASQYCLFAFLAAQAIGTLGGGWLGDRIGRKWVIWVSILGAAPFTLILPHLDSLYATVAVSVLTGIIMASAFSSILVYATDLMPRHTGVVAGLFYGLSFGAAGLGSALFGGMADTQGIQRVFEISSLLPFVGVCAMFLPKMTRVRG